MPLRRPQSGPGPYTRVTLAPVCLSGPTYPAKERLCTCSKGLGPQGVQARGGHLLLSPSYAIPAPRTSRPSSAQHVHPTPDLLQELTPLAAEGMGKKGKKGGKVTYSVWEKKSSGLAEGRNGCEGTLRFPRTLHYGSSPGSAGLTAALKLPGQTAQRKDVTSSRLPGLRPSSWPEASPRTPRLAPEGSCRRPGAPGRRGRLKRRRRRPGGRVKGVFLTSPFCLYPENRRRGEEPKTQLSPLNGDQTPFSTKRQNCLVKGLEGSGLCVCVRVRACVCLGTEPALPFEAGGYKVVTASHVRRQKTAPPSPCGSRGQPAEGDKRGGCCLDMARETPLLFFGASS